jgi:hypothetical protein
MVVNAIAADTKYALQNMVESAKIAAKCQKIRAMFQDTTEGHTTPV